MVGHQARSQQPDGQALEALGEHVKERLVIPGLMEQADAAIGGVQHMVNDPAGIRILVVNPDRIAMCSCQNHGACIAIHPSRSRSSWSGVRGGSGR